LVEKSEFIQGDTHKKNGIILEIHNHGILFEITYYSGQDGRFNVGKQHYISFADGLSFSEI
jgi:hypothetical protein